MAGVDSDTSGQHCAASRRWGSMLPSCIGNNSGAGQQDVLIGRVWHECKCTITVHDLDRQGLLAAGCVYCAGRQLCYGVVGKPFDYKLQCFAGLLGTAGVQV